MMIATRNLLPVLALGIGLLGAGSAKAQSGCSDGTREGFLPAGSFPDIAGCSGGWSVPGILSGVKWQDILYTV